MPNKNRHKRNQPPTGEGKHQSPYSGAANKLNKRSEVLQAQPNHPRMNIGTAEDDVAFGLQPPDEKSNPKRPKAGR